MINIIVAMARKIAVAPMPTGFDPITGNPGETLIQYDSSSTYHTEIFRDGVFVIDRTTGTSSYTDTGLVEYSSHLYKIRHKLGTVYSVFTPEVSVITGGTGPPPIGTPGSFSVNASSDNAVLGWSNSNLTASINVYRNGSLYDNLAPGSTGYTDGPIANDTYDYYLTYLDPTFGEGSPTADLSVTINYTQSLTAPSSFTATTLFSDRAGLTWSNGTTGALISTEIWRDGSLFDSVASGVTSYHDDTVVGGVHYSYDIRHVKSGLPIGASSFVSSSVTVSGTFITSISIGANRFTDLFTVSYSITGPGFINGSRVDAGGYSSTSGASGGSQTSISSGFTISTGEDIQMFGTGTQATMTLSELVLKSIDGSTTYDTESDIECIYYYLV